MSMRQVRRLSVAAALVVFLATAAVLWTTLELGARTQEPPQAVPTAAQLKLALHRVGLDPARLAAAGLSATETSAVVGDVHGYLLEHSSPDVHDAAAGAARAECLRLEHLVRSGQGNENDVAACNAARSAWAQARAQQEAVLSALVAAGTAGLPEPKRQVLAAMRANEQWTQPLEFLTIDLSEPERVALRDALANERISAKKGEAPDPEAQALLLGIRGTPSVALAAANLVGEPSVTAAWDQAVAEHSPP